MAKLKPNQFEYWPGMVITERPILFQTEMVKATIEGRKTQTRRKDLEEVNSDPDLWNAVNHIAVIKKGIPYYGFRDPIGSLEVIKCPYGKRGDLLYVRETWANLNGDFPTADPFLIFKADIDHPNQHGPVTWKPSIHMPKVAARIWLMVEKIRVERLQDISEEDARAEGIKKYFDRYYQDDLYQNYGRKDGKINYYSPIKSFESLWISINGEQSWEANPWVWVVKFRVLSKTGRPSLQEIERNYFEVTGKEESNG